MIGKSGKMHGPATVTAPAASANKNSGILINNSTTA
jgi:hypothetical protein